jgi:hypothetical protein
MLTLLKERRLPTAAYPIRGFAHFLHHPGRHGGPIFVSIIKVVATSSLVVLPLYRYGYTFQRSLLSYAYTAFFADSSHNTRVSSFLITASSTLLCLIETSALTLQLGSHFIGNIRTRLFDSVLKERHGLPEGSTKEIIPVITEQVAGPAHPPADTLPRHHFMSGRNLMILSAQEEDGWPIFFLRSAIFVLTLPLNLVPVVGPFCFINIQAVFRGGQAHQRYFQLYKWTPEQRQRRIEAQFWQYQRFGLVATALEMIPFVGYLFMYTNQIG